LLLNASSRKKSFYKSPVIDTLLHKLPSTFSLPQLISILISPPPVTHSLLPSSRTIPSSSAATHASSSHSSNSFADALKRSLAEVDKPDPPSGSDSKGAKPPSSTDSKHDKSSVPSTSTTTDSKSPQATTSKPLLPHPSSPLNSSKPPKKPFQPPTSSRPLTRSIAKQTTTFSGLSGFFSSAPVVDVSQELGSPDPASGDES
jgi:hypothetical protein